ncbi:aldehyde dehydrogenase [Rhodococcus sp. JS3073]|uniref:aldehyde dehydrogenase n=1 Tax=Rhodococcus sp. JS3073 TaxID=3002901 RepID=UPI00228607CF|nr:aldehyde dehydrogenase [Rhodococcus sp. JS3073]WAM19184.1 aldehyde dehydrogenase [Rhodococcus sp. JS3073]
MTIAGLDVTRNQAFINGKFVDASDGGRFTTFAPSSGTAIASVTACGTADIDDAVRAARRAFDNGVWRHLPSAERKRILLKFAALIEDNATELALLDAVDAGKTLTDCEEHALPEAVECLRWYAEAIDKVFGKTSPTSPDNLALIVREPVGVVAAVLPWNYPLTMLAWKVAPALAAGNSLVIKPAEQSPLSALRLADFAQEAGIPDGVFNVVPGLGEVAGRALGLHHDIDMVSFTGSTEVGRLFLKYAAESNLKQIVLECGGKSPQIVMPDMSADLQTVAEDLAFAAFTNAGQNCTAGSRILVHASIKDELTNLLVGVAQTWVAGDPLDRSSKIGPLIEPSARDRVVGYIERARSDGARIRTGGEAINAESGGNYVPATVIDDVTPDMAIAREEVFGPVVCVVPFESEAEAIEIANDTTYGLGATVWSKDIDVAVRMARAVKAGTVGINGYSEGDITTPFGGYRQSGFGGRDKGLEAFDQYTELKTIWVRLSCR